MDGRTLKAVLFRYLLTVETSVRAVRKGNIGHVCARERFNVITHWKLLLVRATSSSNFTHAPKPPTQALAPGDRKRHETLAENLGSRVLA
jgi:hypothetical protein